MRRGRKIGWDELMIVNPDPGAPTYVLLGDGGVLYEVRGVDAGKRSSGGFFLGHDGTIYQTTNRSGDRYEVRSDSRLRQFAPSTFYGIGGVEGGTRKPCD